MKVVDAKFIREVVVDAKKLGDYGVKDLDLVKIFEERFKNQNIRIKFPEERKNKKYIYLLEGEIIRKYKSNWDRKKNRENSVFNFNGLQLGILFGQGEENGKQVISYYKAVHEKTESSSKEEAKEDLIRHLHPFLKMAEPKQAIYEFVQNASDADATKMLFWMHTDEVNSDGSWFLFANNGYKFSPVDIYSILMLAESEKSDEEIGKYGIGFRLIHRLVMKNSDDYDGLIEDLNGPILFSWGRKEELEEFLGWSEDPSLSPLSEEKSWDHPILFKFLITTFPVGYEEKIQKFPGESVQPFTYEDIKILKHLPEWFKNEINKWEHGSLFIVRFRSEEKEEILKRLEELKGIMTFLKLQTIVWGKNHDRERKYTKPKDILQIDKDEYSFVFDKSGKKRFVGNPNVYNPLPLDDERFGLNFLIHSNIFEAQAHRTKLDNREKMENAFSKLKGLLEETKAGDKQKYYTLYRSIITSIPKMETDEKEKVWEYFKDELWDFLKENVPVKDKNGEILLVDASKVYINETGLKNEDIPLDKFSKDMYWLPEDFKDSLLTNSDWLTFTEDGDKLLGNKKLVDIIGENMDEFNQWLKENKDKEYKEGTSIYNRVLEILNEEKSSLSKDKFENICIVQYNGDLWSVQEGKKYDIIISIDKKEYEAFKELSEIVNIKIAEYNEYLTKILKHKEIKFKVKGKDNVIDIINTSGHDTLNPENKAKILRIILNNFMGIPGYWDYKVSDLWELKIFKNENGQTRKLSEILPYDLLPKNVELNNYPSLKEYFISKKEWDAIGKDLDERQKENLKSNMGKWDRIKNYFSIHFYNERINDESYEVIEKLVAVIPKDILEFEKEYGEIGLEKRKLSEFVSKIGELNTEELSENEIKILLEFLKNTEDLNFLGRYAIIPVIESNGIKSYKIARRNSGDILIFYKDFNPETIDYLLKKKIYIVPLENPFKGHYENLGKIFDKIKEVNITLKEGSISIKLNDGDTDKDVADDILRVYFEGNYDKLKFYINGKESSEFRPLKVSEDMDYPREINWDNVFKDEGQKAVEIAKAIARFVWGDERKYEQIKQLLFDVRELKSVEEILEQIKHEHQNTADALWVLLWLYTEGKKREVKDILKRGNRYPFTLESTPLSDLTYNEYIVGENAWLDKDGKWDKIKNFVEKNQNSLYDFCLIEPYIYANTLYHPPIKEDKKGEFIEMIYKKYGSKSWMFMGMKDKGDLYHHNCSICNEDYRKYVYPDRLALGKEKIPEWLRIRDYSDNGFKEFLENLGVRTPDNEPAIRFRERILEILGRRRDDAG